MTNRISASQFLFGYAFLRRAAQDDKINTAIDTYIKQYKHLLWVSKNEPKKMTSAMKRELDKYKALLPDLLEKYKPDISFESLRAEEAKAEVAKVQRIKAPKSRDELSDETIEEIEYVENIEDISAYGTRSQTIEAETARSVGRSIIEFVNLSFPEKPISNSYAVEVGKRAIRAVERVTGGNKDVEDVISDKLEQLLKRMNSEVVDVDGNKVKWTLKSPTSTGKPGAPDAFKALDFLIGYLKRSAIDVKRGEKMTVDDPVAQLAYLKYKNERGTLTQKEKRTFNRLLDEVPNAANIQPSPIEPVQKKVETYDAAFGRSDEGGDLIESGESNIPDAESDPLLNDIITDPVGAERLMGVIRNSLPSIVSKVKGLGSGYELLWDMIFTHGKGDVLLDIKENMNKNRDFQNQLKTLAEQKFNYKFQSSAKSDLDQYAYLKGKQEKGTITEIQEKEMAKLGQRINKADSSISLAEIEPIDVAPTAQDEWTDFVKLYSSKPAERDKGVLPIDLTADFDNPEGVELAKLAARIIDRPATIGDMRNKLLDIINKSFTAEEVVELEDFYHASDKEKRLSEKRVQKQKDYQYWRDQDRRSIEKLLTKVSEMSFPSVVQLLIEDIETGGLSDVAEKDRTELARIGDKIIKNTVKPNEINWFQTLIGRNKTEIPTEYADSLSQLPKEYSELVNLTEKGKNEDELNRLLWIQGIRPLNEEEAKRLSDLQKLFKGRAHLPTGISPGEGYGIELNDFSKLLKLQTQGALNSILLDYLDALNDALEAAPYDLTPNEINEIQPAMSVTPEQKASLLERAVDFLETKYGKKVEVEVEEKPEKISKEEKVNASLRQDYADLKYLDYVGMIDKSFADETLEYGNENSMVPVSALIQIFEDTIPSRLTINGKTMDSSYFDDIPRSKSKPTIQRVKAIYDRYKSRVSSTLATHQFRVTRVALRIAGLA